MSAPSKTKIVQSVKSELSKVKPTAQNQCDEGNSMNRQSSPGRISFFRIFAKGACLAAALAGGSVLIGGAFDIQNLKSILPYWVTMKANTAGAFILIGTLLTLIVMVSLLLYRVETECRRVVAELKTVEARYRYFSDLTGMIAWVANAEGEVEDDSPAWRRYTGQSLEEFKGWGWTKALHPEDLAHTVEVWRKSLSNRCTYQTEYRIRRTDGEYRHFLALGVPVFREDGSVREWIGACIDINERKRSEDLLRETMKKLETHRQAIEQFAIVAETDLQGRITYANDMFCKISKYSREELIGKDHREVVNSGYHPKSFWKEMWDTIGRGKIWRGDIRNRAKDGEIYWVDSAIVPLLGPNGKPEKYFSIRLLITERKQMEEALRLANEELFKRAEELKAQRLAAMSLAQDLRAARDKAEQLSRIKDGFIATASHELRTPLTAIKEGATLIKDGAVGAVNSEQKEFLTLIDESVDRLAELIDNMLDLAKIEAGRMTLRRRRVSVKNLIETTLKNYQPTAGGRQISADSQEAPDVFADPNKIIQVLGNLFSNAVKFTKDNGTIALQVKEENGEAHISVEDDGAGISEDDLPKLFQKFSQVGNAEKRPKGTGLGLALSKEIIGIHKGKISAASKPGQGSRFTFTLPVYTSRLALEESLKEQLELAKKAGGESAGLIVIDGKDFTDSEEAIKLLCKRLHPTDAVLTVDPHWIVILAAMDEAGARSILERLPKALEEILTGSLGASAALYPRDGTNVHDLLKRAVSALNPVSVGGR